MNERIEWQLMWLEEAVSRVGKEAKALASLVEGGGDLVEEMMQTVMALHYNVETAKGKLTAKPVAVEDKVEPPDLSGEEILPAEEKITTSLAGGERASASATSEAPSTPSQAKPKRKEKGEAKKD